MNDNKYFSEYIKMLCGLDSDKVYDTDLLDIFCEYISSNPDFKYNGTYLRDSIILFQQKLESFKQKRNLITSFNKKLSCDYASLEHWYIIIDNLYVITPDFNIQLLLNFEGYTYFSNLIRQFNLFQFDTDYVSIRYVKLNMNGIDKSVEIENEYLENQKIKANDSYKEIKLYSIIKKTLIPKDNAKVGESDEEQ